MCTGRHHSNFHVIFIYGYNDVMASSCDNPSNVLLVGKSQLCQGYFGECGLRGGYMEVHGIGAEVKFLDTLVYTFASGLSQHNFFLPPT